MCLHLRAVRTGSQRRFDHEGLVANAGLILAGTLMARLGLFGADRAVGAHRFREPGPQDSARWSPRCSQGPLISIMSGCCAPGAPGGCWGSARWRRRRWGRSCGRSRSVTSASSKRCCRARLARAWALGAGPGKAPLVVDVDSTICEVHGKQKQGAAYGLHQRARLSPAARRTRRHRRGARRPHAQRVRGVLARRGALRRRTRREPATRRGCGAGHGARRLGILVMETDRPSRRPQHQMVDHRRPHTRCSRSDPSDPCHRMDRHRLHQRRPRPSRRDPIRTPAAAKPSAPFASSCAAPASPRAHSNDCGPTGGTTHSSPTPNSTPPPPTSSTAPTPLSSSPSATSKKAPDSSTSPQATTARTAHGSPAPCSPTTSATGAAALADAPPATNRSRRTRLVALAAVLVNRSGTPTLRYPARWPWETQFRATLSALRALPGPSG